jgi:hypothetical protein
MPNREFEQLMNMCEKISAELKVCRDPDRRRKLLKQMSAALAAATNIADDKSKN